MRISYVDDARSACLCDDGLPGWHAVTCVAEDGRQDLVLVNAECLGDDRYGYDPDCSQAIHEQSGPLPIEYVRRITISQRTHRCGRRTKSGAPCQTPVARAGDACGWHRTEVSR